MTRVGMPLKIGAIVICVSRMAAALNVMTVSTLSELRSVSAADKQIALLAGYGAVGDGGGGMFYRDAGSGEAIDDGVIVGSASGGRWIRLQQASQPVNLRWYGAKGNNSDDDTAAIQAAVRRAVGQGKSLFVPHGGYKVTSSINITGNLRIVADNSERNGGQLSAYMATAGQPVLNFTGSTLVLENVQLCDYLHTGRGIYARASAGPVSLKLLNCKILYFGYDGIYAQEVERVSIRQSMILGPYLSSLPPYDTHIPSTTWTSRGVVLINAGVGRQIDIFKNSISGWLYAIYIENGLGVVVDDNAIELNFIGVRGNKTAAGTCRNWRLTRNWMEQNYWNQTAGGYFTGGTTRINRLWNNHYWGTSNYFGGDGVVNR